MSEVLITITNTCGETEQSVIVAACEQHCPNGYSIACWPNSEEFESLQRATAQGIDSHLEAISFEQDKDDRDSPRFIFDAKSLGVLCRRLGESENEQDQMLRTDILGSIGIEEI